MVRDWIRPKIERHRDKIMIGKFVIVCTGCANLNSLYSDRSSVNRFVSCFLRYFERNAI